VRVAAVNLNKRSGSATARSRLTQWLTRNGIALLLAQEPWRPPGREPVHLDGYRAVGGTDKVFAWAHQRLHPPACQQLAPHWQRLELGYLAIHHAYLDAYSQTARAAQLDHLRAGLRAEVTEDRPILVVGDFNLAPRPQDGRFDGHPSTFNSDTDRAPYQSLVAACLLEDATATDPPEFSVVRSARGRRWEFRCDLALLSDYLAPSVCVTYDHSVRAGPSAFTDHSSLLIDLPVSPPLARPTDRDPDPGPGQLFLLDSLVDRGIVLADPPSPDPPAAPRAHRPRAPAGLQPQAHKTAMLRRGPSPFARSVLQRLVPKLSVGSILDYGCGRGADVAHYRQASLRADGYDPYPPFGWAQQPTSTEGYDLVTVVFVLNVLPDPWQRVQTLKRAASYLRPGGHLLVVTRSPHDIHTRAARAGWQRHNDGYWSSQRRQTFQRGIAEQEIARLAIRAGLHPAEAAEQGLLRPVQAACQLLLTKPATRPLDRPPAPPAP
jgi:SAM-dependent methyltransferase